MKAGWKTSEFAATVSSIVTNLVAMAVLLGYLPHSEADTLSKSLVAVVGGCATVIGNGIVVWQYVKSRTELKSKVLLAEARSDHGGEIEETWGSK